ncbi:hypothetical protein C8R45DRAFT_1073705 [Mycena sanguinolenta]|nr:hypothetical protein C8R45DRAFT_1073705 [Mycena sanguinolenta]
MELEPWYARVWEKVDAGTWDALDVACEVLDAACDVVETSPSSTPTSTGRRCSRACRRRPRQATSAARLESQRSSAVAGASHPSRAKLDPDADSGLRERRSCPVLRARASTTKTDQGLRKDEGGGKMDNEMEAKTDLSALVAALGPNHIQHPAERRRGRIEEPRDKARAERVRGAIWRRDGRRGGGMEGWMENYVKKRRGVSENERRNGSERGRNREREALRAVDPRPLKIRQRTPYEPSPRPRPHPASSQAKSTIVLRSATPHPSKNRSPGSPRHPNHAPITNTPPHPASTPPPVTPPPRCTSSAGSPARTRRRTQRERLPDAEVLVLLLLLVACDEVKDADGGRSTESNLERSRAAGDYRNSSSLLIAVGDRVKFGAGVVELVDVGGVAERARFCRAAASRRKRRNRCSRREWHSRRPGADNV